MVTFEDLKTGRIKPEFGNLEHIVAVRAHEKRFGRTEKPEEYSVDFEVSGYVTVKVKAHSIAEAEELARADLDINDCDFEEVVLTDIHKITSKEPTK